MVDYIAVIHKDKDSDFGVSFPDFPGCITAGSTIEEARAMAQEALQGHVECMLDEGLSMPEPRELGDIKKELAPMIKEFGDPVYFLVSVSHTKKPVRVNTTWDPELLQALDEEVARRKTTRSAFLADAVRKELHV